jgi:hypothetical protein
MGGQTEHSSISSLAEALEKYNHIPGSTPREKIRNAHAQLRASTAPGSRASTIATPAAGDIGSAPGPVEKTVASVATAAELDQPVVQGLTAPPLLQEGRIASQTIQLDAPTCGNAERPLPGSVQLGPSEFALTLPMDSRVKDEYVRTLADEARVIRSFLIASSSTAEPNATNVEVSRNSLRLPLKLIYLSRMV